MGSFRPMDVSTRTADRAFVAPILGDDDAMLTPASRAITFERGGLALCPSPLSQPIATRAEARNLRFEGRV
jgi:hypothetical protein